ncbi:predicted protein [Verticillium alfalfae VaMs.102]|uniref:Predicted protein n=1 Tax=Verticillium alfalfae (strain VaMs.102 / ATCC MYA-4576 / FGSC 10136) TaxID=526221 RepID=C9SLX3_VERA1|nr:predicted protein [Verticillium alfalfae VaMs.102]EEY19788.1 predicted protein [Verticillium alfalfae VaMs.102]
MLPQDDKPDAAMRGIPNNRRHAGLPTPMSKESDPRHSHATGLTKPSPTTIRTACLPLPHLHSPVCPIKSRPALVGTDTASLPPKEASRRRALLEAQGEDRRSEIFGTERTAASKGQLLQHSATSVGKGDEKPSLDNDVEARRKRAAGGRRRGLPPTSPTGARMWSSIESQQGDSRERESCSASLPIAMRSLALAAAHLRMARALDLDRLLSTAYDWKRHGSLLTDEPERLTTQNGSHFLARP